MTRHLRIRDNILFQSQARIGGLVQQIRDDVLYLLERDALQVDDPELEQLQEHGIKVLRMRVHQDIERLRRELIVIKRTLNRTSLHD